MVLSKENRVVLVIIQDIEYTLNCCSNSGQKIGFRHKFAEQNNSEFRIPNSELIHNVFLQFVPVKYFKRRINVIVTMVLTVEVVAVFP